jgi:hypothetical protein
MNSKLGLLHQPLGAVLHSVWGRHAPGSERGGGKPIDTESSDQELGDRTERGGPGRRKDDLERWWHNRWTRLAAALLGLVIMPGAGAVSKDAYDKYMGIPTPKWVAGVDDHVARGEKTMEEYHRDYALISQRLTELERRVEQDQDEARAQRVEVRQELRDLRNDLHRWFVGAGGRLDRADPLPAMPPTTLAPSVSQ